MLKRKGTQWLQEVTFNSYRKRVATEIIEPVISAGFYPQAAIDSFFELSGKDFYRMLKQFPGPIMVANGENDEPNRGAENNLAKSIPAAQFSPIPGASHLTNLEQPEEFNQTLRNFAEQLKW